MNIQKPAIIKKLVVDKFNIVGCNIVYYDILYYNLLFQQGSDKMFIGREKELSKLERMYKSGKFETAIIYGRRRVGKTTLINEFCKGKKNILFPAIESNDAQNLSILSGTIAYLENGNSAAEMSCDSFSDAFLRIGELAVLFF